MLNHDMKVPKKRLPLKGPSLSMQIHWAKAEVYQQFWAAKWFLYFLLTFVASGWRPKMCQSFLIYFFFL